jgi:hypothetical protein
MLKPLMEGQIEMVITSHHVQPKSPVLSVPRLHCWVKQRTAVNRAEDQQKVTPDFRHPTSAWQLNGQYFSPCTLGQADLHHDLSAAWMHALMRCSRVNNLWKPCKRWGSGAEGPWQCLLVIRIAGSNGRGNGKGSHAAGRAPTSGPRILSSHSGPFF